MIYLPRAMAEIGDPVYRGLREDSLDGSRWSWWAVDRAYAESYGEEVIEGRLPVDASILDLREAIREGLISGESLDAIEAGLATVIGLDADEEFEADRLWDVAGGKMPAIADWLGSHGYDGLLWIEQDGQEAYLLLGPNA